MKELESLGKGLKDWNGFVDVIQAWLGEEGGKSLQVNSGSLSATNAKQMIRY